MKNTILILITIFVTIVSSFSQVISSTNTGDNIKILGTDLTLKSTNFVSIGSFPIAAGEKYCFTYYLQFKKSDASTDIRIKINGVDVVGQYYVTNYENSQCIMGSYNQPTIRLNTTTATGSNSDLIKIEGFVKNPRIDTSLEFFIRNSTGTKLQTIGEYSYLMYRAF